MKPKYGVDTNVLVTWLLSGGQTPTLPEPPYRISLVVLAELSWVLKSSFRHNRSQIAETVRRLLNTGQFELADFSVVEQSLRDFESGKAGFADFLLINDNLTNACAATLTFDKDAARNHGFILAKLS